MSGPSSSQEQWLRKLRELGDTPVDAIVRVADDPEARAADLQRAGVVIRRTLRLVRGFAVRGPARVLYDLAEEPWVVSVEPDLPVHTFSQEEPS